MRSIRSLLVVFAVVLFLVLIALLPVAAGALTFDTNSECRECHADVESGAPVVDFGASPVSYSRCMNCHHPPYHWRHYATVQCSSPSCHPTSGWPARTAEQLLYYSDTYVDGIGYFSSSSSMYKSAEDLHRIHANGSWPQIIQLWIPWCDSCHEPTACSACHGADPNHGPHAESGYPAVTYDQCVGVDRLATADTSFVAASTCANGSCHSLASAANEEGFEPQCQSCHDLQAAHHALHDASATMARGCNKCHDGFVDDEHLAWGHTCATCHDSGDEMVQAAIADSDPSCTRCHGEVFHYMKFR